MRLNEKHAPRKNHTSQWSEMWLYMLKYVVIDMSANAGAEGFILRFLQVLQQLAQ